MRKDININTGCNMKKDTLGTISSNLLSLQMQLKTVLEEAGGDAVLTLLDALCMLNRSEQVIALRTLNRIVKRIVLGDNRLFTSEDSARKDFEDGLYNEITRALRDTSEVENKKCFSVLDGGKCPEESRDPIDFLKEKELRKSAKGKPYIN